MTVRDIYGYINSIAPYDMQLGFDNSGLNVGGMDCPTRKIGICLDLTAEAVDFAHSNDIE